MFRYTLAPIRFGEFDLGGVLYHSNYFHLYEEIREAWLRERQVPYRSLVERGFHLAIVDASLQYLLPIYYGTTVNAELTVLDVGRSSFTLGYRLFTENDKTPIHTGSTKHVFVAPSDKGLKPSRLIPELEQALHHELASS